MELHRLSCGWEFCMDKILPSLGHLGVSPQSNNAANIFRIVEIKRVIKWYLLTICPAIRRHNGAALAVNGGWEFHGRRDVSNGFDGRAVFKQACSRGFWRASWRRGMGWTGTGVGRVGIIAGRFQLNWCGSGVKIKKWELMMDPYHPTINKSVERDVSSLETNR